MPLPSFRYLMEGEYDQAIGLPWWAWPVLAIALVFGSAVGLSLEPTPAGKMPERDPFCFIMPQPGLAARCVVTDVYDGDTVTVELRIPVRVRLLDCWAPELRDPGGAESKAALENIAKGKVGVLWVPLADVHRLDDAFTFGRLLAHLRIDGSDKPVSQLQVESGQATTTKGGQ